MINLQDCLLFHKMHALGNDFVIFFDINSNSHDSSILKKMSKELVCKFTDRKYGIGCDQLIIVTFGNSEYDYEMHIYNTDGSTSGLCGNATRCVVGLIDKVNKEIIIKSGEKVLKCTKLNDDKVEVNLGRALEIRGYETIHGMKSFDINIGNPHLVIIDDVSYKYDHDILGKYLHDLPCFPEKTNVNFVKIINHNMIEVITWERGVGLTNACGSGASASAYIAYKNNLASNNINVQYAIGSLNVSINDNDEIVMIGDYCYVFNGKIYLE